MKNSDHEASSSTNKCFSCILRRLLCAGSLPTHPSDQISDDQKPEKLLEDEFKVLIKQASSSSSSTSGTNPGVVARLMGLDSFPNTPSHSRNRSLGSFLRSRSVNSIDFCSVFDPTKQGNHHNTQQHQHRRVRTSVSFREEIIDNFGLGLMNLGDVDERAEYQQEQFMRPKEKKGISQCSNLQEKKISKEPGNRKSEILERRRRSVCVNSSSSRVRNTAKIQEKEFFHGKARVVSLKERRPMDCKEALIESKCVMKKKRNNSTTLSHKVRSERNMRKVHPEISPPTEMPPAAHSEKALRSKIVNCDNGEVKAAITGKNEKKLKNEESDYYKRLVEEICRVTTEDMKENWIGLRQFEDFFEDISQELGQEILDILLKQFVDELVHCMIDST